MPDVSGPRPNKMEKNKSTFDVLNDINVNEYTSQKNGLTYLPWAWAWQTVKSKFPEATYTIHHNADGWNYHHDGRTAWVECSVTIGGIEHTEHLPVMNNRNQSIKLDQITSMDVTKAIQRCITKACGRHGLGLYVYAGEDLPEIEAEAARKEMEKKVAQACDEIRAATSRAEFESVWRKWAAAIPTTQGSEFMRAAQEMANKYPKQ